MLAGLEGNTGDFGGFCCAGDEILAAEREDAAERPRSGLLMMGTLRRTRSKIKGTKQKGEK